MKIPNRPILILALLFSSVTLMAQNGRWGPVPPRQIDEFKFSTQGHVKLLLDGFFNELNNNPADQGHIIIYPKTESQRRVIEKIITGQIKARRFEKSRLTIVKGSINADGIVQFWSVSPGAEDPNPILGKETTGNFEVRPNDQQNPLGTGIRRGSGDGTVRPEPKSGIGSSPKLTTENTPSDVPFRILSKPRAKYTQAARDNDVQGSVELHITFLPNGTIGVIKPVTQLSHGLTDEAVKAAKLIRFQPDIKNGLARTTTRVLTFTFNIY